VETFVFHRSIERAASVNYDDFLLGAFSLEYSIIGGCGDGGRRACAKHEKTKAQGAGGRELQFTELGFGARHSQSLSPMTEKEARATLDAAWSAGAAITIRRRSMASAYRDALNGFLRAKRAPPICCRLRSADFGAMPAQGSLATGRVF